MSKEEQQRSEDLFRLWEERVRDQAKSFNKVKDEALKVDKEISTNSKKITEIRTEQARLRSKQEATDHSIQLILDQQDALEQLLAGLQTTLEGKLNTSNSGNSDAGATSQPEARAKSLGVQLDELDRQVKDLTQEARDFQTTRYSEPLVRVGHVLDAHTSELDAIEERVHAAFHRLRGADASA